MKLHLPKRLLAALLATFSVVTSLSSTAWAGWNCDGRTNGYAFYYDGGDTESKTSVGTFTLPTSGVGPNTVTKGYKDLYMVAGYSGPEGQESSFGKIIAEDGVNLTITANPWQNPKFYSSLVIEELEFGGGSGSGSFNIINSFDTGSSAGVVSLTGNTHHVTLKSVSGTLSSVTNEGNLTLGSVKLGGNITNNGVLNIAGTLTGSGAISNGENAKLVVDLSRGFSGFEGVSYSYANGSATGKSGFVKGEQTFRVLSETIDYIGDVYVTGSETPTSLSDGKVTIYAGDSTVFYVEDTWSYNSEQSSGATSFQVSETGTLNFAGSTAAGGMTINSEGTVALTAETTLTGTVTVNGGTFTTSSQKLNGDKLVLNGVSSATISGNRTLSTNLELNNTYLTIGAGDTFDYDDGSVLTFKIGSGATLDVQGNRQSVRSDHIIEMAGGTIKGSGGVLDSVTYGIDFYDGGKFNVTADSRIETNVGGHKNGGNIEFAVAAEKTLTMTGNLVGFGSFRKTAGGTMVYSGAAFTRALTIDDGVFEYSITDNRDHSAGISGTGTLRKSGAGTLTLSSANTTVTNLAVTAGKLVYNVAEGEKTHTLSGTGGTFEKAGDGTLKLGNLTDYNFTGDLAVSEGKVVFDGVSEEKAENPPAFVKLVNSLTTKGDGLVEIAGDVIFNYTGANPSEVSKNIITVDDNIHITGNLSINSYDSENAPDGDNLRRWNVNEGGNLSVDGHLLLTNKQKMVVDGGVVSAAGGVQLGHSSNGTGNWTNHSIYSKLIIEDGGVTTSGLTFHGGNNELLMSGGELTFTPTATEDNPVPNVLSGGGTETYKNKFTVTGGTLKATDTSWALKGTISHVVSLGNATFDIAANKTVTLRGDIALTGALTVTGEGALQLGATTFSTNTSVLNGLSYVCDEIDAAQNGMSTIRYQVLTGDGTVSQLEATSVSVSVADSSFNYTWDNGDIVGHDSAFVINTNFSTVDASAENGATMADTFVVNQTGKFTVNGDITGGKTAEKLVACTLGTGTMVLATDATMSDGGSVAFAGNLEIATGGKLTLGKSGVNSVEYPTDLSSLSSLDLNGGTLEMYYVAPHIKSMTVVEGSTNSKIYIVDTAANKLANKADATRMDSLLLGADLLMETNWKSNVNIGVLSGKGNLAVKQNVTGESNDPHLWIDGVDNYTGEMSLKGKLNLNLNSGDTETVQAVRLSVDDFIGNIVLGGKVAASLNIGESEVLNNSQLTVDSGSSATLTGSGLYNLGVSTNLGSGVSLSNDTWTGTVSITGATTDGADLSLLGNASSKVALNGLSGWIQRTNVESLIELWGDGMTLTAYSTSGSYNFSGGISGTGNLILDSSSNADPKFNIGSNGTSGWEGGFVVKNMAAAKTVELKMVGGGELMAAGSKGIQMNSNTGTLSFIIGNSDAATTMNGAVNNTGTGTLNMTVQGDTEFKAGVNVSQLAINGSGVDVILSGADNAIGGNLSIASGNSLTLAKGSALTVNSPIQNGGNLDIQGTVNWDLGSTEGLTVEYAESELTRTDNGLGAGVIKGLITGNGTLVDNGNVAATVNDKTGTLATGTGLVTVNGVVYYVMNTPKLDEPDNLKEDRGGEVYSFANGTEVLISDVVHVGVHDRSDPEAAEGANTALGFYVGTDGVLCIMGDSETMTAGEILASTQGSGDIILRTPGYQTDDALFPSNTITLSSKTNVTGNFYLSPYVRYAEQGKWAHPQAGITLHLNAGADISSFSAVHLCHPDSVIMINGEIGKSDSTGGHINNLTSSGASDVFLCFNKEANSEIILAGKTTIQGYDHGTVDPKSEDGTGNPVVSNLHLDVNHEDVNIVIKELHGKQIDPWNVGYVTFSTGLRRNYGGEPLTSISGTLDINSFKYEGYVALIPVLENSTLHTNITLLENEQLIDSQIYFVKEDLRINEIVQGDASLTIKGAGRYILSDGNSIDYSSWTGDAYRYNFGVLDSNWIGTVEVNNLDATIDAIKGIKIADYGNENSTIHFKGFKGYLKDSTTAVEIKQDLILENTYKNDGSLNMNAYEITSGDTGQVQTYTGDISGTGDFVVSADENMTFNLQGDLSEWKDGAELKVTAGTQAVNFSDAATVINADVLATNGATMNADISNTESVTVNGKVKADGGTLNLSVNTAKGTTFTNEVNTTFTNEVNVTKISVGADSTAKLKAASSAGNVSIGSYGEGIATLSNGLTIEENTVGHGHIADTMISQIQKAGRVELVEVTASNLYLYGNQVQFHSTDSTNQFKFDKQISYGSERVNEVVFTSEIFRGMILSKDGAQLTLTVNDAVLWGDAVQPDWTNVTIKLKGFTIEQLAGTAGDWDWKKFGLSFDSNSASVATLDNAALSTTVSDLLNDKYEFVKYEQSADGLIIRMYNTPEPTTATLSMLALAALAARRRRRK